MKMRTRAIPVIVAMMMVASAPSVVADEPSELNETSLMKVGILADFVAGEGAEEAAVAAAATTVSDMRLSGIGWGALFKIYKLAEAMDVDPATLAAEIGADGSFDFGTLKNSLTDEQRAVFDALPKNFGTLKASEKKAAKALEKAERKAAKDAKKAEKKANKDAEGENGATDEEDEAEDE